MLKLVTPKHYVHPVCKTMFRKVSISVCPKMISELIPIVRASILDAPPTFPRICYHGLDCTIDEVCNSPAKRFCLDILNDPSSWVNEGTGLGGVTPVTKLKLDSELRESILSGSPVAEVQLLSMIIDELRKYNTNKNLAFYWKASYSDSYDKPFLPNWHKDDNYPLGFVLTVCDNPALGTEYISYPTIRFNPKNHKKAPDFLLTTLDLMEECTDQDLYNKHYKKTKGTQRTEVDTIYHLHKDTYHKSPEIIPGEFDTMTRRLHIFVTAFPENINPGFGWKKVSDAT